MKGTGKPFTGLVLDRVRLEDTASSENPVQEN